MAFMFFAISLSIMIVAMMFATVSLWLIYSMYKFHRFEFYLHYKKKIGLVIVTNLAMYMLVVIALLAFSTTFCIS